MSRSNTITDSAGPTNRDYVKGGDAAQEVVDDGTAAGLRGLAGGVGGPGAGGEQIGMRRPQPRKIVPRGDGGGAAAELLGAEQAQR